MVRIWLVSIANHVVVSIVNGLHHAILISIVDGCYEIHVEVS